MKFSSWIFLFLTLISVLWLVWPKEIELVQTTNTCIPFGRIIKGVEGKSIKTLEEFKEIVKDLRVVEVQTDGKSYKCKVDELRLIEIGQTPKLGFGLKESYELCLKDEKDAINQRMRKLKLEGKIHVKNGYLCLEILPEDLKVLNLLLKPGRLEGKLDWNLSLKDGKVKLSIGDESFELKVVEDGVEILGKTYKIGQSFNLKDVNLKVVKIKEDSIIFEALIFSNQEFSPLMDQGYVQRTPQGLEYRLPIELNKKAFQTLSSILANMERKLEGERIWFKALFKLELDGVKIHEQAIPLEAIDSNIFWLEGREEKAKIKDLQENLWLYSGKELKEVEIVEIRKNEASKTLKILSLVFFFIPFLGSVIKKAESLPLISAFLSLCLALTNLFDFPIGILTCFCLALTPFLFFVRHKFVPTGLASVGVLCLPTIPSLSIPLLLFPLFWLSYGI